VRERNSIEVLNVGDLKPSEYLTEFFMDMAWNIHLLEEKGSEQSVFTHLNRWIEREFGTQKTPEITSVFKSYYHLANFRKPEHTGWSKVEESGYPRGLTPVINSEYNPNFNNELQNRIAHYQSIEEQVKQLRQFIPAHKRSAFFQLVEYPVRGASLMNRKWLYAQLADYSTNSDLKQAKAYAEKSLQAYKEIEQITNDYAHIENGKWNRMMDYQPRKLPVFDAPIFTTLDSLIALKQQPVCPLEVASQKNVVLALNAKQAINLSNPQKIIDGLGHSFAAVQMEQGDSLSFVFNLSETGEGRIKIATIPNHDVDGNGMRISLSVDGKELPSLDYRVSGRSEIWKQNVLRGQAISTVTYHFLKPGKTTITLHALTPHIIVDQIMVEVGRRENFYEFPINSYYN
jgi:hypothetical protein